MRRKLFRPVALLLFLLLLPLFTGCLDSHEIETLAIVSGLAIDRGEEKNFRVTAELISSKNEETSSLAVSAEGDTVYDCIKAMGSPSGKQLYLSHCKVCIVALDITEKALPSLIDWASRDPESRLTMSLLLSEAPAGALLSEPPKAGTAVGFNISDALSAAESELFNLSIHKIIDLNVDTGKTPYVPVISLSEEGAPQVKRLAFLRNYSPAGLLADEELIFFSLLRCGKERETFTVKNDRGAYTVELTPERADRSISHTEDSLQFQFDYEFGAELVDISYPFDPHNEDEKARMEVELECVVKNGLRALAARSQSEFGLDIAGLGSCLYRSEPAFYDALASTYPALYNSAAFDFTAHVTLRGSGVSGVTVFGDGRGEVKS